MPYHIEILEDKPIIVVTLHGRLTLPLMREVFERCDTLMRHQRGHVYRVMDARNSEANSIDLLEFVQHMRADSRGFGSAHDLTVVYVGGRSWVKFITQAIQLERFGGNNTPIFQTLDDALMYVHINIADRLERSDEEQEAWV